MHDVLVYRDYLDLFNKTLEVEKIPENQQDVYDAILALTSVLTFKSTKYGNKILKKDISILEEMIEIKFDRFLTSKRDDDKLDLAGYIILWFAKLANDHQSKFYEIIENALKD